jgi:hypothetical protein
LCRYAKQRRRPASKRKRGKRLDTRLQAEAAEFFVLGHLLLEGIAAYKAYTNFPGYDLVAVDERHFSSTRIQVKSRYPTNHSGIIIQNLDCDFVVMVALNRGYSGGPKRNGDSGIKPPEYYVFPIDYIRKIRDNKSTWGRITKTRMRNLDHFKDRWDLIRNFLEAPH